MNIVYLIGNGFDINIGLKTRYKDFYDYYLSLDPTADNEQVKKLKSHLKAKLSSEDKYWSDLEIALGNYTTNFSSLEELELAYNDLNDKFRDFIIAVDEQKFELSKFNIEKLKKGLAHPENCFCRAEKELLLKFYRNWGSADCDVKVISFNYTSTLEQLLNYKNSLIKLGIGAHHSSCIINLSKIIHIHGTRDIPLIGLNDKSQIANADLREVIEVQEYLLKPLLNKMQGHRIDSDTLQYIKNADVICVYGLSLGRTDGMWWDAIAQTLLSKEAKLLYYAYDNEIPPYRVQWINRMKRHWKDTFLNSTKLTEEEKKKITNKIFVVNRPTVFDIFVD